MDKSSDSFIHFDATDPGLNPASDIIYYFWNDFEFGERKMNEGRCGGRGFETSQERKKGCAEEIDLTSHIFNTTSVERFGMKIRHRSKAKIRIHDFIKRKWKMRKAFFGLRAGVNIAQTAICRSINQSSNSEHQIQTAEYNEYAYLSTYLSMEI